MNDQREHHPRLGVPAKRYRIGELVRYSPFSRQTIHNYTIMGLIREAEWTEGGHRLYDESVFDRLSRILELRQTMSLTEIRHILQREDQAAPGSPALQTAGAPASLDGIGGIEDGTQEDSIKED
jgi:DNA-binding transcriptional MerR regulator